MYSRIYIYSETSKWKLKTLHNKGYLISTFKKYQKLHFQYLVVVVVVVVVVVEVVVVVSEIKDHLTIKTSLSVLLVVLFWSFTVCLIIKTGILEIKFLTCQ